MNDRIDLKGILVYGFHGVLAQEKELGQRFVVDVTLFGDFSAAARHDDLNLAVDYSRVHDLVVETMVERKFDLIEAVAGRLCSVLLENMAVESVAVTVEKTTPPIPGFHGQAAVTLHRDRSWLED